MNYYRYKKLSNILMPFNCIFGITLVGSFFTYWYLFPVPVGLFALNLWFFDKTHKVDLLRMQVEDRQMRKTHDWLGHGDEYRDTDVWRNKETGKITER